MTNAKENSMDRLGLVLCLGGVLLAASVAILGKTLDQNFTMIAYGIFVAFQVAAFVLGIVTRAKPLGKTAAITSAALFMGSLLLLS